jgi:hypothetical protein
MEAVFGVASHLGIPYNSLSVNIDLITHGSRKEYLEQWACCL